MTRRWALAGSGGLFLFLVSMGCSMAIRASWPAIPKDFPPRLNIWRVSVVDGNLCWCCPQCDEAGKFGYFPPIVTSNQYDKGLAEGERVDVPGRWLCKNCGWYWSEKFGERQCVPDYERGVWMFKEDAPEAAAAFRGLGAP